jgi:glycosyltransferase involved in cell wall biosynthesis
MRSMRILYVSAAYKPADRMGGPVVSVPAAAEALVRAGHEVTVATTNANFDRDLDVPLNQPVAVDGVTVWYFRREEPLRTWLPFLPYLSHSSGFMYAPEMKTALPRLIGNTDVVHTHTPFVYPAYAASRVALRLAKPLFYHQRGNLMSSNLRRRGLKKLVYIALFERPIMKQAACLIALTEAERAAFTAIAPRTPCEIVPNGIVVPAPDPGAVERVAARWGIPPDVPVILYLARLETRKGSDELLATFARVQSKHPETVLVMAGIDEFNARARGQSMARRGGYAHRLLFTGPLSGRDKEDVLHRADLFCLPSRAEGFSMSALEALAHGTAVMLSPGCNFPEAERAGAGMTVPRNVDAMVEAMDQLLHNRQRLRAMGKLGRELALRSYSWDAVGRQLADLYARAVRS